MNIKNQLLTLLTKYEVDMVNLHQRVSKTRKNEQISDAYRNELLEDENKKFQAVNSSYRPLFNNLIDQAIRHHEDTIQRRMNDNDYQLKLSNVISMIKLAGDELDPMQINLIVEPFIEDEIAKKVLDKLLQSVRGDFSLDVLAQPGVIGKSIENLESVRANLKELTTPAKIWSDIDNLTLNIFSIKDGIERFDNQMIWTGKY